MITFGQKIKQLRLDHGYTQIELAEMLNTSQPAISMYEQDIRIPKLKRIRDFAEVFNVSYVELLGE